MGVRLNTLFSLKIEKLEGPTLSLERDDRFSQVHDGTVCSDGPPDNVVRVLEVDDDGLGRAGSIGILLADADIFV
jgi:hypothetical protein